MGISRTRNTLKNMFWGIINKCIGMILAFVLKTILIKKLGEQYLGLNSLFVSILNVLNLAELGISGAIVCSMYRPIAEGDEDTICALIALYRKVYRVIGIVILCLGMMILPFVRRFIKGDVPDGINIYVVFLIYLFSTVLSYMLFAYRNCLIIAHQRNDIVLKIQMFCSMLQSVIQIFVIIYIRNYYIYIFLMPIFVVINNLLIAYISKKLYPYYVCKGKVKKEILDTLKEQIMGLFIGRISSTIRASIDSLYISMFLGLTTVAMYNNYFGIVTIISGMIQLIENAMVASVGNSIVTETVEKNYEDFKKFTFILQWIVVFCTICLLCLIQPFMKLWMGKSLMFKDSMAVLCALYLLMFDLSLIRSVYTQATGMWWKLKKVSIADIFVNLFLNLVLVYWLGAYGVLLASVLDVAFISIPWTTYYLFKEYFGIEKFKEYMITLLSYIFNAGILGTVLFLLCDNIYFSNLYLELLVKLVLCTIIVNLTYIVYYKNNKYFLGLISIIKNKIKAGV